MFKYVKRACGNTTIVQTIVINQHFIYEDVRDRQIRGISYGIGSIHGSDRTLYCVP